MAPTKEKKRKRARTPVPASPYGHARELAEINAQIERGFRGMRFAPVLELAFRAHFDAMNRTRARITLALGAVLIALFGVLNYPGMPDRDRAILIALDFGLVVPLSIVTFAMSYVRWFRSRLPWLTFTCALLFGLGRIVAYTYAWRNEQILPYEGLMLVMLMAFLLLGLTFHRALVCCAAIWMSFLLFLATSGFPQHIGVLRGFFCTAYFIVGAVSAYMIEYSLRHSFLYRRLAMLLADNDDLTGLHNRRKFLALAAPVWKQAQRSSQQVAMAVVDIDEFKAYNDTYGHLAGDRALSDVAQVVGASCRRPFDACARYGGEEFVLLWPDTSPREAQALADQLVGDALALDIPHVRGRRGKLTISVGVAVTVPGEEDIETLIARADRALYRAKEEGRNRAALSE